MMAEQFNRYHIWLGIPKNEQPANHYRLLGLTPGESDPNVIAMAADRQMGHVRSFQNSRPDEATELSGKLKDWGFVLVLLAR